jgi:carbon-monoxide dehydrogenase large subunit
MIGWVGQRLERREDSRLLRGAAHYLDDLEFPRLAYVAILRSPHAHAAIRNIDLDRARNAFGVVAVICGADVVKASKNFPVGPAWMRPLVYHMLAVDRVRFVGDPVAAVVAESQALAEDALEHIVVDYESLEAVANVEEARRPDAPKLFAEWPDNVVAKRSFSIGQVDQRFATAPVVVRETFVSQRQTALPLELRGCVASWDEGSLTLWSSTQVPHMLRSVVSEVLDVSERAVRVVAPDVGGGFGTKCHVFREEPLVGFLARIVGRPVKWREDIREHFSAALHARDQQITLEVAAGNDGTILAMRAHVVGDVGAGMTNPPSASPVMIVAASCALGLRVQHVSFTVECLVTNKCPCGAYRGFGNPVRVLAVERCLDMLAERVGIDPAEVRRRNLVRKEDMPQQSATGARIYSGTFIESMERALKLADYDKVRRQQQELRAQGRYLGIGIASFAEGAGPSWEGHTGMLGAYDACTVRIEPDGQVTVQVGVCDQGQGTATAVAQVVADALSTSPENITVTFGDTGTGPFGLGNWGSRGATVAAGSSSSAALELRTKLIQLASHLHECSPDDVRLEKGRALIVGSDRSLSFRDLATAAYGGRGRRPVNMSPGLEVTNYFEPDAIERQPDDKGRIMRYATISNAAHIAVVEVIAESGEVRILDYVVVHDCGTVINPAIVDGQIRGGVTQGIAGALHESIAYDDSGQLLTGTLMDYHVPRAIEVPNFKIDHLESPDPTVPLGVKGVGESGTIGAPAAIANAVADALAPLGVRIVRTGLTPPVVLGLIEQATRRADVRTEPRSTQ